MPGWLPWPAAGGDAGPPVRERPTTASLSWRGTVPVPAAASRYSWTDWSFRWEVSTVTS
jgi:hypothetical protein